NGKVYMASFSNRLNVYGILNTNPDFVLQTTPTALAATSSSSVNFSVNVTYVNGFSETTSLSAAGLPAGVTASFTPTSLSASGASTLMLTVNSTTQGGTYNITITGTSGSRTHSILVRLTVVPVTAPSIGYVQGAGTSNDGGSLVDARSFGNPNTIGNLIVAAISWGNSGSVSCSDSQGNTYAVATIQYDSTNNQSLAICYAAGVKGGANTVTATFS